MLRAPNLASFDWLIHGFGQRDSRYPAAITTVKQIHSAIVIDGSFCSPGAEGDAITAREPGTIVGVRTADCVPILIADRRIRAVAATHAGWRGTAQNIVTASVRALITRYGSRTEDLHVAIGPAIGPCHYEVGPEVARHFATWCPELKHVAKPVPIDLAAINEGQLREAGVGGVWRADECTFCNPDRYFSFRREKEQAGRMISFIGLAQT
jgi:YfiH family protein